MHRIGASGINNAKKQRMQNAFIESHNGRTMRTYDTIIDQQQIKVPLRMYRGGAVLRSGKIGMEHFRHGISDIVQKFLRRIEATYSVRTVTDSIDFS